MSVSLRIENLTKTFAGITAVQNVSLTVEPAEIFFLLGPSGCGKTTLLRCIAGFHTPDAGNIFIGDADVTRMPPHRRNTGMVFQNYALWPHLSVAQNIAFGLEMRKIERAEIRRRVADVLENVRMAQRADARPNQLSGGQQQRVALARALVIAPRCLLLDEPLSNLDAKLRIEMRSEIRRICKQSALTAVYVTHDQKEALSIADRLAVMRDGVLEQIGSPAEVYRRPANRFVAEFMGEANVIPGTVVEDDGHVCRLKTPAGILTTTAGANRPVGARLSLCLRPEAIRLDPAPEGQPNRIEGVLHHTLYQGETAHHRLTLSSGCLRETTLGIFEINPEPRPRDPSARVCAWVAPRDIHILPAESVPPSGPP